MYDALMEQEKGRKTMSHQAAFEAKRVEDQLIGGKITAACVDDDSGDWGFIVTFPGGKRKAVWVMSDEEGNDCGAFAIDDLPTRGGR